MRIQYSKRSAIRLRLGPPATTCATCEFCWRTKTRALDRKGRKDIAKDAKKSQKLLCRFALHLHTRPFFQQRERGGIVEVAVAVFGGHFVDLLYGF